MRPEPTQDAAPTAPPGERPWWRRRRLWIPLAALLLLVVLPAAVVRFRGLAALRAVRARHAAAGMGADPEDLLAGLPPGDERRQAAWRRVEGSFPLDLNGKLYAWERAVEGWLAGEGELPVAEIRALLDRDRALLEEGAAILADGPVRMGASGGLQGALPRGAGRWRVLVGVPCGNLLVAKLAGQWYRLEALTAADPSPALAGLDGLAEGTRHPATLLDAMIGLAVAEGRDRAYADLALAGRLPPEAEARWLAEEPEHLRRTADGYRGERLLFLGAVGQEMDRGDLDCVDLAGGLVPSSGSPGDWVEQRGAAVDIWLHGAADLATALDLLAATEAALRGRGAPPSPEEVTAAMQDGGGILATCLPNLTAGTVVAAQARLLHRMARLCVRIVRLREERGRLPADGGELRTWLGERAGDLDPGPADPGILYACPAPGAFRLEPDGEGPVPVLLQGFTPDPGWRRRGGERRIRWSMSGIEIRFAEVPPPDAGGR